MDNKLVVNIGDKYGRLSILNEVESKKWKRYFLCKCDCGNETVVSLDNLRSGHTQSCGCLRSDTTTIIKTKHGLYGSRLYRVWADIKKRCLNSKHHSFKDYGGRGIILCNEWKEYLPFYNWAMANGYQENLTIERIENNGNYEPGNCKWIPQSEQGKNTRANKIITYNEQSKPLCTWAKELGIKYDVLQLRLSRGWSIERAFNTPLQSPFGYRERLAHGN